jgi:hypothetical protein
MGRARDLANILSSSGNVALDSEMGLSLITPTSISTSGGSGTISTTGAVSFTSASAISLNSVFTSTYDNYKILFELTGASTSTTLLGRLRVGGTDATAGSYTTNVIVNTTTTVAGSETGNATYWDFRSYNTAVRYVLVLDVLRPNTTGEHLISGNVFTLNASSAWQVNHLGGKFTGATAYDSISFIANSGNITGTVRVYGYRN